METTAPSWKPEKRRRYTNPTPDRVHGTSGGYTNYGCRCESCVAAQRAYSQDYRARRRGLVSAQTS